MGPKNKKNSKCQALHDLEGKKDSEKKDRKGQADKSEPIEESKQEEKGSNVIAFSHLDQQEEEKSQGPQSEQLRIGSEMKDKGGKVPLPPTGPKGEEETKAETEVHT